MHQSLSYFFIFSFFLSFYVVWKRQEPSAFLCCLETPLGLAFLRYKETPSIVGVSMWDENARGSRRSFKTVPSKHMFLKRFHVVSQRQGSSVFQTFLETPGVFGVSVLH
jgi:hypothetical protein